MTSGDLVLPLAQILTTVRLSQLNNIFWRCHEKPHVCTAMTIAYNSFHVMFIFCCSGDHLSCSHPPDQYAPHPSLPEASVNKSIVVFSVQWDSNIRLLPDQWGRKVSHHCKSGLASDVKSIWWCNCFTVVLRSTGLRKKFFQLVTLCMKRKAFQLGIVIVIWCIYVANIDDVILEVRTLFARQ